MSVQGQKEFARHRGQKQWTLEIPMKIHNENDIVRRGTREPDVQQEVPNFSILGLLIGALVALLIFWIFVILIWV
jgi:hypothetical protein